MEDIVDGLIDSLRENIIGFFRASNRVNSERSPYGNNSECQKYAEAYVGIFREILSMGDSGIEKLRPLLMDPHPGVRLRVAGKMEKIDLESSIQVYRELSERPSDERGIPDVYAAGAGLSIDRLSEGGFIK